MEVKICLHCASVFLPARKKSVYCLAPDCQWERKRVSDGAYRARPEVKTRHAARQKAGRARLEAKVCRHCASVFLPRTTKAVYCRAPDCQWARRNTKDARRDATEQRKAYHAAYRSRPEVKERKKAYMATYHARPEVKDQKVSYMKDYFAQPGNRERRTEAVRRRRAVYVAKAKAFDELMQMTGVSL